MKILYFHQYFKTTQASGSTRSYEMAKSLVENGHEVTVVFVSTKKNKDFLPLKDKAFINGQRRGVYEKINLIEFDLTYSNEMSFIQRFKLFISYALRSIRLVRNEDFDLLFASSTPLTAGIPGIVMKWLGIKKAFVFEVRDLWPELPREMGVINNKLILWLMSMLEKKSYNSADAIIALSPGIEKGIRKKLKKNTPVYMVPNGSDLNLFKPGKYSKSIFPNVKEDDFVAIFAGAHGIANGLNAVIDAAIVLKEKGYKDKIKIVFIGGGAVKPKLVERAAEHQLDNCIFIDFVTKNNLEKYLQAADVGLMVLANVPAFYYGTSPNKFFDYLSIGLPVFNNYPGWLAELIQLHECGIVVKPDDKEEFARGLIDLSSGKYDLKELGNNARRLAEREFSRERLALEWCNAIEKTSNNYYHNKI